MKKTVIIGFMLILMSGLFSFAQAQSEELDPEAIKTAISKYKEGNYVGCISDLRLYTEKDPSSSIAWYYLGNSYMNIAMQDYANKAYDKVIELNDVPILASFSKQAQLCMQDPTRCNYQHYTREEIMELLRDPIAFTTQYFERKNGNPEDANVAEIQKLIDGSYSGNIHPDASTLIRQEKTKMQQNAINVNSAYIPQNQKVAEALQMLNGQKNNSNFAMMLDLPPTQSDKSKQISPEMLQLLMLQNQMPNF